MKKFMLFASALAGLFFAASCQQENLEPVKGNTVTYTVEAPGTLQTKAIADGTNVNELIYEVWYGSERLFQSSTSMAVDPADGKNKATVTLDLVNDQTYTVLFWAQVAGTGAYDTEELTAVSYAKAADEYLANDESLAAFYAVDTVTDGVAANSTVLLKRPFAQVNLCTLNDRAPEKNPTDYSIALVKSKVRVDAVPTTFNVATKEVDNYVAVEFGYNDVPSNPSTITVNGEEYYYAGMNYVFAGANLVLTYDIQTSLNGSANYAIVNNTISEVPVKENYRTNIVGNLLTSKTDYEIIVDAEFNANDYTVENGASYISISTAEELAKVAEEIAAGNEEYTSIMLGGDIDLAEFAATRSAVASNWIPIGTEEKPFTGVFDGNGYTIKNLALVASEAIEGKVHTGFFGYAKNATIKDVTFENVYINIPCLDIDHSQGHIGAVAGTLEGTSVVENVTVKGDIKIESTLEANGASRVAVVVGGNTYANVTMKNVHVVANEGSYLKANNNVGALAGQLQNIAVFENCSSNINVTGYKFFAGGLVGLTAGTSTFTNCHTTGDVTILAGREGRHNDEYRVGGIAGGWADGKTKVCTLVNCSYTGNVSGQNADGTVAEPLDYMGYVGRGYTLSNCAGSKVVIDGVEFVQVYDNQYGIYAINGVESPVIVTTVEELNSALNNAEITNIVLVNGEFGTIVAKSNKTIVGSANAKVDAVVFNGSDNVTLKNIVFDAATAVMGYDGSGKAKLYANIVNDNNGGKNTPSKGALNIVIDGCTFAGKFANGGASIAFTDQSRSGGFSGNITIKNCTFDTVGGYYDIYGHYAGNGLNGYGDFVIENNTFKTTFAQGCPVYLGRYASSTPVVVKGNTFETVASLADAVYVQDHSSYGVSVNAENNTFGK